MAPKRRYAYGEYDASPVSWQKSARQQAKARPTVRSTIDPSRARDESVSAQQTRYSQSNRRTLEPTGPSWLRQRMNKQRVAEQRRAFGRQMGTT